ncbi:hypothetical protein U6Q21_12690, partial [Cutibacterium acnes]
VVKNSSGALVKNAINVGKGNAAAAVLLTAGTEAIGATIKITENYSLYGNNIEKLKEENAKVVGEAAYKTVVVSGTSVAGSVIFGALGSLAGPAGTIVGATVGGFIGSWVGDLVTKNTPAWVENAALKAKDVIYAGTEFVADTVRGVQDGFKEVKKHVGNLVEGAKD